MRRREFITLLGGAAAWPLAVGAQQPAAPVVGFLDTRMPETYAVSAGFSRGPQRKRLCEGREHSESIIAGLAALMRRRPPTKARPAGSPPGRRDRLSRHHNNAANDKRTRMVPIVFVVIDDPVSSALSRALARPGGNLTGFTISK